jgi:hypothetical protein
MTAYHNYLTILIIASISFLVASSLHRYSNKGDVLYFLRKLIVFLFEFSFKSQENRVKYSFITKPLLVCTECLSGWLSMMFFCDFFVYENDPIEYFSHLILTVILSMYITRKLD